MSSKNMKAAWIEVLLLLIFITTILSQKKPAATTSQEDDDSGYQEPFPTAGSKEAFFNHGDEDSPEVRHGSRSSHSSHSSHTSYSSHTSRSFHHNADEAPAEGVWGLDGDEEEQIAWGAEKNDELGHEDDQIQHEKEKYTADGSSTASCDDASAKSGDVADTSCSKNRNRNKLREKHFATYEEAEKELSRLQEEQFNNLYEHHSLKLNQKLAKLKKFQDDQKDLLSELQEKYNVPQYERTQQWAMLHHQHHHQEHMVVHKTHHKQHQQQNKLQQQHKQQKMKLKQYKNAPPQ